MGVALIPDPPPATVTVGTDPAVAGGTSISPVPPASLMQFGADPLLKVGGVFDDRVFDDFPDNYVFDCGQVGANRLGDPAVVELVTIPDPVTA